MEILKKIACIFLLLGAHTVLAQTSFYRVYGGNGYDRANGAAQLPDSSYLVTGTSSSFQNAPSQAFLLKLDKYGLHQWSKSYGGSEFEEGQRVIAVPNFGYYIVGTSSSNGNAFDGYVVFTDLFGNQLWERWYDNGGWERFHDALLLPDTSLILMGETNFNPEQEPDHFMVRIDKYGNQLWANQFGGVGVDYLQKGERVTDSTFVVVGTGYLADSLISKGYVATFHRDGTVIWDTLVGVNGKYTINDVHIISGNIICVGEITKPNRTDFDEYVLRISTTGVILDEQNWDQPYSSRYVAFVNYTAGTGDRFFTVNQTNNPQSSYAGGEDFVINRFNSNFYWDGYGAGYNALGQDQVNHLIQTNDGYAFAVGFHSDEGYSTGGNSLFVIKLGSDSAFPSNAVPTVLNILSLDEHENPSNLSIFPNPFHSTFEIQSDTEIDQLEIRDVTGKLMLSVENPTKQITTDFLESGTYFIRINSVGRWTTAKLIKN